MPLSAIPQIAQIPGLQAALDAKAAEAAVNSALALKAPLASPTLTGAVTINGGTITAAGTPLTIQQTWNNGAIAFGGLVLDITDTASDAASSLLDLSVGGSKKFLVGKTGALTMRDVLRIIAGTITADAPALDLSQTWNNAAVDFTAAKVNVTNTASGAGSKLADLQLAGSTIFAWRRDGISVAGGIGVFQCQAGQVFLGCANAVNAYGVNVVFGAGLIQYGDEIGIGALGPSSKAAFSLRNTGVFCWGSGAAYNSQDTGLERDAAGVVKFTDAAGNLRDYKGRRGSLSEYLDVSEMTAPGAPGSNTARLYCDDSGGKSRLMVLFPSGAAQQLAIEP